MPKKFATTARHLKNTGRARRLRVESLESRRLLASDILVSAIDAPSNGDANHSSMSIIDLRDGEVSPVIAAGVLQTDIGDPDEGVVGLTVLPDGTVVSATSTQSGRDRSSVSELVVRESLSSVVVRRLSIELDGTPIAIADLTNDADGRVLGVTATLNDPTESARLVEVDVETGEATLIGDTGLLGHVSIAMHSDGTLFATSQDSGFSPLTLHQLDTVDASVIESNAIQDHTPYGFTTGLAVHPESGLLYGSESHLGRFFTIDPVAHSRTFLSTQSPLRGVSGDIAFATRYDADDVRQLFYAGFNEDADDFSIDNSGGDIGGLWHRSLGRREDGLLNHSLNGSFYYGLFEGADGGGNTILDRYHRGVISSPEVSLPAEGTSILSFSYLLDTRAELTRDFVTVSIDDGTAVTPILSRAEGTLPETEGVWLTATYDLSAFAGQTISVDFEYDSGDPVLADPEGWYVDDVVIVHLDDPTPLTADVSIEKYVSDETPNENQIISYTLTATHSEESEATATSVLVTDVLPDGVSFVSSEASEGIYDPQSGVWDGIELIRGEMQTLVLSLIVNAGTAGQTILNSASIISDLEDPNDDGNQSEVEVTVNSVDLSVDKTVDNTTPTVGESVTFEIVVANAGDSNAVATGVTLVDVLPVGLSFVSASDGGMYDDATRAISWDLPDIEIGGEIVVTVVADVAADAPLVTLVNVARAEADETDPDVDNNESTASFTPQAIASQTVQFLAPLSVFRARIPVLPAPSQIAALGFVWEDTDQNGIWDASESAVNGATVSLFQGTTLFGASQTGSYDLDENGVIDPQTESGIYFFASGSVLDGTYQVRVDLPDSVSTTFPASGEIEIEISQSAFVSQRPIGTARQPSETENSATNLGISQDFVSTPTNDIGTIIGYSWADVNQNGLWDENEEVRKGVQYFLDLNDDGVFDPQLEPTSITDDEGRYRFASLSPGSYVVREPEFDELNSDSGTVLISTFPESETSGRTPAHTVVVSGGEVVQADRGIAQAPNFGAMEIGLYVRPADVYTDWFAEYPLLHDALATTQSFRVDNNSSDTFRISQIDGLNLDDTEVGYVSIRQVASDRSLIDPVFPIDLPVGGAVEFVAFYAPVQRNANNQVTTQQPDWLSADSQTQVHTFAADAGLEVVTDTGLRFPIKLVGGSTFDSDVNYDGVVDVEDATILNDVLLLEPVVHEQSVRFDPSKDINVRCPNGADQVTGTCDFSVGGAPAREISLGDFGPINVEVELFESGDVLRSAIPLAVSLPPGNPLVDTIGEDDERASAVDEVMRMLV